MTFVLPCLILGILPSHAQAVSRLLPSHIGVWPSLARNALPRYSIARALRGSKLQQNRQHHLACPFVSRGNSSSPQHTPLGHASAGHDPRTPLPQDCWIQRTPNNVACTDLQTQTVTGATQPLVTRRMHQPDRGLLAHCIIAVLQMHQLPQGVTSDWTLLKRRHAMVPAVAMRAQSTAIPFGHHL